MPGRAQDREHRPTPELITGLASRVLSGEIRLPKFQREFVWSKQQVLDLMDSISRNYPIGSLLLCKSTLNLASDSSIAGFPVQPRRDNEETVYLLDGCQRLSAICGALHWKPVDPKSNWNIIYDLELEEFAHREDLDDPPSQQIPLRLIPDWDGAFLDRIEELPSDLRKRGRRLLSRFTRYEVAVVTLDSANLSEIGQIFERVNTRGTPLTRMQIARAATWTGDFDLFTEIDRVRSALEAKHYGKIDRDLLARAVAAAAGLGFSKDDILGLSGIELGDFRLAITQTEEAARRAVDFLWKEIGTPTANALPYPGQLAVVIEIFRQVPKPDAKQYREIRRWFWRTALSGYYENWSERKMRADRDAISAFAGGAGTIDVEVPALTTRIWETGQYNRDSARTKTFALMLAAAGPRDLRTGARIDTGRALAQANDMEYHHFFPKKWLTRSGTSREKANVHANIVMLTALSNQVISDQRPSAYLQREIDFVGEREMKERLSTLLVSEQAFQAAMQDDYEAFTAIRADDLLRWALTLSRDEQPARKAVETSLEDVVPDELDEVEDNTSD